MRSDIFACPRCSRVGLGFDAQSVTCASCGATYPIVDGIVDFVAGTQRTLLDELDYDAFYMVDAWRIASAFESLKANTGSLLHLPFDNVLELGAGTGFITTALLQNVSIQRLVVTDISHKMLVSCRARMRTDAPNATTELMFATNDGIHFGVAPRTFDLVVCYFVVHHVTHYEQTLAAACEATGDRGVAVFVEPNARFFRAMVHVLYRVLARLLTDMPDAPGSDLSKLLNLNNEWEFTLRHADNRALLSKQEDKHFFERAAFEEACRQGGWAYVDTLPLDPGGGPLSVAKVYAKQLGLTPDGYTRFIDTFLSELPGPFALLDEVDSSPSYVFLTAKRSAERELWYGALPKAVPARVPIEAPLLGYSPRYDLRIHVGTEPPYVDVQGWIAATRPVRRVVVSAGSMRASFVVGLRRSDVYGAIRHVHAIPFENALHSGVRMMDAGPDPPPDEVPEAVRITLELDDGKELLLAERLRLSKKRGAASEGRLTRIS